jgi:hypothetical protein
MWRPQKKGKHLILALEMFEPVSQAEIGAIEAEATAVAPFKGCASITLQMSDQA